MLGLLHPTDPIWVETVEDHLGELLSDHAHCELKAAQSALSLLARFGGEWPDLVAPLTALAAEETDHFAQVHAKLAAQGGTLGVPASDGYVKALQQATKTDHPGIPVLLDRLLVSALIEARSCERFRLLAEKLDSMELRGFYRELMISEAQHYRLFAGLAEARFGFETSRERLRTLAEREAKIAASLPLSPVVHG